MRSLMGMLGLASLLAPPKVQPRKASPVERARKAMAAKNAKVMTRQCKRRRAIVMGMLVLCSELGGELRKYRRRIALARMRRGWRTA